MVIHLSVCAGPRSAAVFPEKRRLVVSGVYQREQLLSACCFLTGFKEKQFSFASLHFPSISRCSSLILVHLLSQRIKKKNNNNKIKHLQRRASPVCPQTEDRSIFKPNQSWRVQLSGSPVSPPLPPTLPPQHNTWTRLSFL